MQTLKFSRLMTFVTIFVLALLAAACSPAATTPTAAPGASGETAATAVPGGESSAAGDPEAAAKGFFDALLTGGDPASFLCSATADAQAAQDGYKAMAAAYANAKISTDGLTYTSSDVTADKATVTVGGNLSIDTAGVKTDVPFTTPVSLVKESSGWKIC